MKNNNLFRYLIISLFIIIVGVAIGYYQITPVNAPKNYKDRIITLKDVKDNEPNFLMTMSHVYEMSKEPHANGSIEIEKVRNYLTNQFKMIGCQYQVQDFSVNLKSHINDQVKLYNDYLKEHPKERNSYEEYFATLGFSSYEEKYRSEINYTHSDILNGTNYLVKIDAPNTNKGVMFVSHYDSTNDGPGAGDDLISVASMLEAIRGVKLKNKIKNDIYFLFTDAEESYLWGADSFIKNNPDMKNNIDLVINSEARGNSGTLLMFQTSDHNMGIVKIFNKAVNHNTMFSFTAAVYKIMPNDTDLTRFLDAGYPGMNFSMVGNIENYHKDTDNYRNLDRNSAYMYFKTITDLADYFSTADLDILKSNEDAVYFPFLKGNTIIISSKIMLFIAYSVGLLTFIWIIFLFYKKQVLIINCLKTITMLLISVLGSAFVGITGSYLCSKIVPIKYFWFTWTDLRRMINKMDIIFYLLCFLVVIGTLLVIYRITDSIKNIQALLVSGMIIFNSLNWISIFILNSLAYIFAIPLCFLFIYSISLYFIKRIHRIRYISLGYMLISNLTLLMIYTPIIYLIHTAFLSSLLFVIMIIISLAVIPIALLIQLVLQIRIKEQVS